MKGMLAKGWCFAILLQIIFIVDLVTIQGLMAQESEESKGTKLTWEVVSKSKSIFDYANYLEENPEAEHVDELKILIDKFFKNEVTALKNEGKKIIHDSTNMPRLQRPLLMSNGSAKYLVNGIALQFPNGLGIVSQIKWYSDPTNPIKIIIKDDTIAKITGRGIAIVGNEVYTFLISEQIENEKKSSIEKPSK